MKMLQQVVNLFQCLSLSKDILKGRILDDLVTYNN